MWESEEIPDSDLLYRRVNINHVDGEIIMPIAFSDTELSTDWSRYCTDPNETKQRVILDRKDPSKYGVVSFEVGKVREIPRQIVCHTPSNNNRSHSEIIGKKELQTKVTLMRILNWIIPV